MSKVDRTELIDCSDADVSVSKQCKWLGICRSSFYYRSKQVPEADLSAMHQLDRLYLEDPTRGTRRMRNELRKLGFKIGRDHTRWIFHSKVYHLFHSIVYQCFTPKFTTRSHG